MPFHRHGPAGLLGLALALLLAPVAPAQVPEAPAFEFPEHSAKVVSYDLAVRLDPETHVVHGRQRITWRNDSDESVPTLWFHLYLNAFLNDRSTLILEGGQRVSREWLRDDPDYWGYCRLLDLKLADGRELLSTLEYRAPDDANPEDRTVARVLLPEAVQPGQTIELLTRFESKLPHARRRSGHVGDYHFAAQWFPKLGVYEGVAQNPDTEGWYCHQYHAHTEFYADFGDYRLSLTLPPEYGGNPPKVGATGLLTTIREATLDEADGKTGWLTFVFEAEDVHDCTWTADPDFVVTETTYRHADRRTEAVLEEERFLREEVGVPAEQLELPEVQVRLLIQPEHEHQTERHLEAVLQAMTWYGLWFGPYPYPQITVVDPQHDGRATGGMEYPMIFSAGTRWRAPESDLRGGPEIVTVHEFGHQYFYLLIGNNEAEEAWLDEGFNSYADDQVADRAWGGRLRHAVFAHEPLPVQALLPLPTADSAWSPPSLVGLKTFGRRPGSWVDRLLQHPELTWARPAPDLAPMDSRRRGAGPEAWKDPMDRTSFRTLDGGSYGAIAYSKPALVLTTLERTLGRDKFLAAVREYCARHRFRHPDGTDFFRVLEEVAGLPLEEGRAWLAPEKLDYAVHSVTVEEVRPPQGLVPRTGGLELVTVEEAEAAAAQAGERRRTRIRVQRRGGLKAPVEIEVRVTDEDAPRRFRWDGRAPWHEVLVETTGEAEVVAVDVDPQMKLPIDADRTNNHWRDEKSDLPSLSWAARVLTLIQSAMLGGRTLS